MVLTFSNLGPLRFNSLSGQVRERGTHTHSATGPGRGMVTACLPRHFIFSSSVPLALHMALPEKSLVWFL